MNGSYDALPALRIRVEKEFRELPGLRLTRWQAARLWNLQPDECDQLLERLVHAKVLSRTAEGFAAGELCQRGTVPERHTHLRPSAHGSPVADSGLTAIRVPR